MAKKPKTIPPIKQVYTYEVKYRRLLRSYVKKADYLITKRLFKMLKKLTAKYRANDDDVIDAFAGAQEDLEGLFEQFAPMVVKLLTQMKNADRKKFYRHYDRYINKKQKTLPLETQTEFADRLFGVSLENILEQENIQDSFALAIEQNLDLIKTLTEKQLSRIKNVVLSDLRAGNFSQKTIRDTIEHDFGISSRHADFIARDQSHKMTSTLNQLRYQNLGWTKYIWRTARDRRVRGTPKSKDGLYPNARPSHYAREGKVFEFKKPPKGGGPGQDYNCRCYAEPIIETED